MNEDDDIVSKPIFRRYLSKENEFWSYCRGIVSLSPYPYYCVLCFLFIQCFATYLLFESTSIFIKSDPFASIAHFLSFFIRFGAEFVENDPIVGFSVINLCICFAAFILKIVIRIVYGITGKLSKTLCRIIIFDQDIVLFISSSYLPAHIANLIARYIIINQNHDNLYIGALLLAPIFYSIYLFEITFITSLEGVYSSRSFLWSSRSYSKLFLLSGLSSFFSRLVESIPISFSKCLISFIICSYLVQIGIILLIVFRSEIIPNIFRNLFFTFYPATLIMFTLNIIIIYGIHLDPAFWATIFLFVLIFSNVIVSVILKAKKTKELRLFDMLESKEIEFDQAFPSVNQYIRKMRNGIRAGHPLIFQWTLQKNAINCWPHEREIWYDYIKMLALYPEANQLLVETLNQLKEQLFEDYVTKYFIKMVKKIINSRNKHISSELRKKFKILDEKSHRCYNLLSSYWMIIKSDAYMDAFSLVTDIRTLIYDISNEYIHLSILYQSNPYICQRYGDFLENIVYHPAEASIWKNKVSILKSSRHCISGQVANQGAFDLFPQIPKSLNQFEFHSFSNGSESQSLVALNSISLVNDKNEEKEKHSSFITLAQSTQFQNIVLMFILTFIIYLLAFPISSIIYFTIFCISKSDFQNIYRLQLGICEISQYLNALSSSILLDSLGKNGFFSSTIPTFFDSNVLIEQYQTRIASCINNLTEAIHQIELQFSVQFSKHLSSLDLFMHSTIDLSIASESNVSIIKSFRQGIREAFAMITEAYSQYQDASEKNQVSVNSPYVIAFALNPRNISLTLRNISQLIISDYRQFFSKYDNYFMIFYVIILISILIIFFFLFHITLHLKETWKFLVYRLSCLPRIALEKTIHKFLKFETTETYSNSNDRIPLKCLSNNTINRSGDSSSITKLSNSLFNGFSSNSRKSGQISLNHTQHEFKTSDFYSQTITSISLRGHGFPTAYLLIVLFVFLIVGIFNITISFTILFHIKDKRLQNPVRLYYNTVLVEDIFSSSILLTRLVAYYQMSVDSTLTTFSFDNFDDIISQMNEIEKSMISSINSFLLDDINNGKYVLKIGSDISNSILNYTNLAITPDKNTLEVLFDYPLLYDICIFNDRFIYHSSLSENQISQFKINQMKNQIFMIHQKIYHYFCNQLLKENINQYWFLDYNLWAILMSLIFVSSIIGGFFLVWYLSSINKVRKNQQFLLSTLSMVDTEYSMTPNIFSLFSSHSLVSLIQNNNATIYMKALNFINEGVIIIGNNMHVLAVNSASVDLLGVSTLLQAYSSNSGIDENEDDEQKGMISTFTISTIPSSNRESIRDVGLIDINSFNDNKKNQKSLNTFNIQARIDVHLQLISKFSNTKILDMIEMILKEKNPDSPLLNKKQEFSTSLTDDPQMHLLISLVSFEVSENERNVIMIIRQPGDIEASITKMEAIQNQIDKLQLSSIPARILDKYQVFPQDQNETILHLQRIDQTSLNTKGLNKLIQFNNIFIVAFSLKDFSRLAQVKNGPEDLYDHVFQFRKIVKNVLKQTKSGTYISCVGVSVISAFNVIGMFDNLMEIGEEIMSAFNYIISDCNKLDIKIGVGITFCKDAPIGEVESKSLNFSIQSPNLIKALKLAKIADNNCIVADEAAKSFIPNHYKPKMIPA